MRIKLNLKMYISKKAIVSAIATAAMVASASTAFAATSAELQAQIDALMAQLAALQTTTTVTTTFTTDLTIGSTGPQVVALQTFLVQKGYLVMPAGVSMGYFGGLTQAALARFQAANGIVPAAGYFGPITRGRVNAMLVANPGSNAGGVVIVPGTGTEGQLDNFDSVGSIGGEDINEGDSKAEVLGIEFDAEDSAMTIDRVDVDFSSTGSGSKRLDHYVDSVSLWLDGKKLASQDVDEADEDNDVYSFRFSGLNGVVAKDDTAQLVVAVDAVNNVDSADARDWTVSIPEDGIRATDTKGISDTYISSSFSSSSEQTFSVDVADTGTLDLSENNDNPDAMDVAVDDESDTDDVTMLKFDLDANDSDVTISEIPVSLNVTGATDADQVVRSLALYQGSTLLDTKSISSASASTSVTFDDLDVTIDDGDTETFTVKANVNDLEGTAFEEGDAAYVTVYGSLIDAEDENGEDVDASGDVVTGNTMTFRMNGITTSFVSADESVTAGDAGASTSDTGTFTIKYKVTAFGDDVYVDKSCGEDSTSPYATTQTSYGVTGTVASTTCSLTSTADEETNSFRVDKGTSETFTLTVAATATADSFVKVDLRAIGYALTDINGDLQYTSNLDDYETDPVFLNDN